MAIKIPEVAKGAVNWPAFEGSIELQDIKREAVSLLLRFVEEGFDRDMFLQGPLQSLLTGPLFGPGRKQNPIVFYRNHFESRPRQAEWLLNLTSDRRGAESTRWADVERAFLMVAKERRYVSRLHEAEMVIWIPPQQRLKTGTKPLVKSYRLDGTPFHPAHQKAKAATALVRLIDNRFSFGSFTNLAYGYIHNMFGHIAEYGRGAPMPSDGGFFNVWMETPSQRTNFLQNLLSHHTDSKLDTWGIHDVEFVLQDVVRERRYLDFYQGISDDLGAVHHVAGSKTPLQVVLQ